MLLLPNTTDKIQVVTNAATNVDVHASYADATQATPPVVNAFNRQNTAITTATTTDVVASPGASTTRNIKTLHVRNKSTTTPNDVTVLYNANATTYELFKATLKPGDHLEYIEGVGFFVVSTGSTKLDTKLRVANDVVFATAASFADITGLTCNVYNGKHYCFEAYLFHVANATTTGAQFGINGPTMTSMRISEVDVILGSVTAATMGSNVGDVTARDTASIVETTGAATVVVAQLYGWINPSADGVFAIRGTSEVSVAAGLTIKAGSWCRIFETDN